MNKKYGFTLQEILIALTIVGTVTVLSISMLTKNVNDKMNFATLKNITTYVQQAAVQQMAKEKTKNLINTAFYDPAKLLSYDEEIFEIVKYCKSSDAANNCWNKKTVTYKTLSGSSYNGNFGIDTAILKNGVVLGAYVNDDDDLVFLIDVNGKKHPNVVGEDLFAFAIKLRTNRVDGLQGDNDANTIQSNCTNGDPLACFAKVRSNGWEAD